MSVNGKVFMVEQDDSITVDGVTFIKGGPVATIDSKTISVISGGLFF